MSVITKGRIFANGEQLTAEKLNVLVDEASFNSSTAVDNSTTRVSASGAITVKPQGITSTELAAGAVQASNLATSALAAAYPVGSIYMNASNSNNPSTLLGFGTWAAFGAGRVPVGIDSSDTDFDTAEETGGAKTHTLTTDEMPSHTHNVQVTQRVTGDDAAGGSRVLTADRNISTATVDITGMTAKATGGGQAHNNLQPYIVVYMWKRTA
jgi:hypothetical protein